MIIESLVDCCSPKDHCVKNTARVFDWITALALLVIGILAVSGVLHLSPHIGYAFIGAGAVYLLANILKIEIKCKS